VIELPLTKMNACSSESVSWGTLSDKHVCPADLSPVFHAGSAAVLHSL
jgi:hypothetical protein